MAGPDPQSNTTLAQLVAQPGCLQAGGRTYLVRPLTLVELAEIECQVLRHTTRESECSPDKWTGVPVGRLADWIRTRQGTAFALWLALRGQDRAMTLADAAAIVERAVHSLPDAEVDSTALPIAHVTNSERCIDWPRLFRLLAKSYGWTTTDIGQLTLSQVELMIDPSRAGGGRRYLTLGEYQAWRARRMASAEDAPSVMCRAAGGRPANLAIDSLAEFRQRLPEIYSPLGISRLQRLGIAVDEHRGLAKPDLRLVSPSAARCARSTGKPARPNRLLRRLDRVLASLERGAECRPQFGLVGGSTETFARFQ